MRGTLTWLIALVASNAACLRQTEFHCTTNAECGAQGTCEQSVGFCSFPDSSCGSRFGNSAGPYANQCVDSSGDAGIDGPKGDAQRDAPPPAGCPSGYNALGSLPHLYKLITANDWISEANICANTSSSAYLAIPDDLTELQALDTLSATTTYWVGIDDLGNNGTYLTVKGAPATFLPWAAGQPSNSPSERCVSAISAAAQIQDDKCNTNYPAICECEP